MYVEVFSMAAAIGGMTCGTTWQGNLNVDQSDIPVALERIFRLLNRVDEADLATLNEMGYFLPSLSVGDFVTLHIGEWGDKGPVDKPQTFQVKSMGFEKVTGNQQYAMREFI